MTSPPLTLAVDLGGTKVETAVVDAVGVIVPGTRHRRPTGASITADALSRIIRDAIDDTVAASPHPVGAAGIGSAGPIDLARGTVHPLNMPAAHGLALRDLIVAHAGVPATLRLDGTCIALAEHWLGATRGARTSLSMVVSTGVGGGLIVDGRLLSGGSGNAGHIGQVHVQTEGPLGDVADSTLERVASGPAAVAWAHAQGWRGRTGEDLAAGVRDGEPLAEAATRRSAEAVGQAIASVAALLDLEAVAIGGGFSRVRPDYLDIVADAARRWSALPQGRPVEVRATGLSADGPLIGAAALRLRADLL